MDLFLDRLSEPLDALMTILAGLGINLETLTTQSEMIGRFYTLAIRWLLPLMAAVILLRCLLTLLGEKREKTPWGYLQLPSGLRISITRWENLIGRGRFADIVINVPTLSRSHAVLTHRHDAWLLRDLGSKGGSEVNGTKVEGEAAIDYGDTISLAGLEMTLFPAGIDSPQQRHEYDPDAFVSAERTANHTTLALILLFQFLGAIQVYLARGAAAPALPLIFLSFFLLESLHYVIIRRYSRRNLVPELIGYFLCGLNLLIVASSSPGTLLKQLAAILIGMIAYTVIIAVARDLDRAHSLRYLFIVAGLLMMILNLALGKSHFGARNWIDLGFISFQPMEFVKIAFVLAGTATLDRLLTTRNMTAFIGFSGASIITLALINDLGTALIFFGAFVMISFMHSGNIRTLFLFLSGAAFGGLAVVIFKPHIAARFALWGKAWQFANSSGYQQTRTMIAAASGGLLGVGGGRGYLVSVAAADTDLVFGMLCEEWGLLLALVAILMIVFLAFYAVVLTRGCRSSFYAIAACGAATIFILQMALNVLGSVDLLPFTGVTIPFISNGGSSMIASWGLLALIKAAE